LRDKEGVAKLRKIDRLRCFVSRLGIARAASWQRSVERKHWQNRRWRNFCNIGAIQK